MITEQQHDFAELRTMFLNYELGLRNRNQRIVTNAIARYATWVHRSADLKYIEYGVRYPNGEIEWAADAYGYTGDHDIRTGSGWNNFLDGIRAQLRSLRLPIELASELSLVARFVGPVLPVTVFGGGVS